MLISNQTRFDASFHETWEEFFHNTLETLNFCKDDNNQPLVELAISRKKKRPQHRRFTKNFVKFFKTSFLQNTSQ